MQVFEGFIVLECTNAVNESKKSLFFGPFIVCQRARYADCNENGEWEQGKDCAERQYHARQGKYDHNKADSAKVGHNKGAKPQCSVPHPCWRRDYSFDEVDKREEAFCRFL
tara:strand:- start:87 stop:419 length:333 start_codon:yes stop_codon:yes gene_type:complete